MEFVRKQCLVKKDCNFKIIPILKVCQILMFVSMTPWFFSSPVISDYKFEVQTAPITGQKNDIKFKEVILIFKAKL